MAWSATTPVPTPRRGEGRRHAQRQVYFGCGTLAVCFGVGLIIPTTATREEGSMKVIVGGTGITVFGLVSVVQALTNTMPNDDDE